MRGLDARRLWGLVLGVALVVVGAAGWAPAVVPGADEEFPLLLTLHGPLLVEEGGVYRYDGQLAVASVRPGGQGLGLVGQDVELLLDGVVVGEAVTLPNGDYFTLVSFGGVAQGVYEMVAVVYRGMAGETWSAPRLVAVDMPEGLPVWPPPVGITAGHAHTCALVLGGMVRCWGAGGFGQLGDGGAVNRRTPVEVRGIEDAVKVAAGAQHTCAMVSRGVYCWGWNLFGQLGNPTVVWNSRMAVPVLGVLDAVDIAAGGLQACAVVADGGVWCWGEGALGWWVRPVALPVAGIEDAVAVTVGWQHACAIVRDGSVWCWGSNADGRLGDGTTVPRLTPVLVANLTDTVAISAGAGHTCAIRGDGAVYCWGRNENGWLGDGTKTSRSSPVRVSGLESAISIAAGARHTCAIVSDGTGRCWGSGWDGKLGNGRRFDSPTPVAVVDLEDATAVAAGGDHSCAIVSPGGGGVRCWGENWDGQLGNGGPVEPSSVPVPVQW